VSTRTIIVLGAGAAGMLAAMGAMESGAPVIVLERNDRPGRKLSITGKGRCNLTTSLDSIEEFLDHVPANPRFLYSALNAFTPLQCRDFFHSLGIATQEERGRRIFPAAHTAKEVSQILARRITGAGGAILIRRRALRLTRKGPGFVIDTEGGERFEGSKVIIATGGKAYPRTGSTGDGYDLAASLGHSIVEPAPSLVPLVVKEEWVGRLEGLSLRNVRTTLTCDGREEESLFGEMVFTAWGLSGPVILRHSRKAVNLLRSGAGPIRISINLKPALDEQQMMDRLSRDRERYRRRHMINALGDLLPQSLIPVFVDLSGIPPHKERGRLTRSEEERLRALLKNFSLTVIAARSFAEAEVTQGGVDVREIDPRSMESLKAPGAYFAGEVMDVDGYIGGFNLQIAFSTGLLAGRSAARRISS
jgi:predicted Rossmann fold flavoprotein